MPKVENHFTTIAKCRGDEEFCREAALSFHEIRKKNSRLMSVWHPSSTRINLIYVGEAPPGNGRYIYNPCWEKNQKRSGISTRILKDLKKRHLAEFSDIHRLSDLTNRLDFLMKLKQSGIIVVDSCQCPIERLGPKKKAEAMENCFKKQSSKIIDNALDNRSKDCRIVVLLPRNKRNKKFRRYLAERYGNYSGVKVENIFWQNKKK